MAQLVLERKRQIDENQLNPRSHKCGPYVDRFQQIHGWRPSPERFRHFSTRVNSNPTFFDDLRAREQEWHGRDQGYRNWQEYEIRLAKAQREHHELQLRYEQEQEMNQANLDWQEYEMAARA